MEKKKKEPTDKSGKWVGTSEEKVKKEFAKYKTARDLKDAAGILLRSTDKNLRKKEDVETLIIHRIRERKALLKLGQ